MKKTKPDIQKQLKRTLDAVEAELRVSEAKKLERKNESLAAKAAEKRAEDAAMLGLALVKAGKIKEARAAHKEAEQHLREYRRLGGKGKPL